MSVGDTLSPIEQRVYDLLVDGNNQTEIAEKLKYGKRSVNTVLKGVYLKKGTRNQIDTVATHWKALARIDDKSDDTLP